MTEYLGNRSLAICTGLTRVCFFNSGASPSNTKTGLMRKKSSLQMRLKRVRRWAFWTLLPSRSLTPFTAWFSHILMSESVWLRLLLTAVRQSVLSMHLIDGGKSTGGHYSPTLTGKKKLYTEYLKIRIPTARIFPSNVSGLMGFPVLSSSLHSPCTPMISTTTVQNSRNTRHKLSVLE